MSRTPIEIRREGTNLPATTSLLRVMQEEETRSLSMNDTLMSMKAREGDLLNIIHLLITAVIILGANSAVLADALFNDSEYTKGVVDILLSFLGGL